MQHYTLQFNIILYADDAVLFYSAKNKTEIEVTLNEELSIINNWIIRNHLFLNTRKTEFILFGTNARISQVTDFNVKIGNKQLNRVTK